jgi:hypothetical protein
MKIIGVNVTGSFILNGVDVTTTVQSSSIWSGSLASSVVSINSTTSSLNLTTGSLNTASGSAITRLNALEVTSGSNITRLSSLETASGSAITRLSSIEATTASLNTTTASINLSIGSLNATTASLNTITSSLNSSVTALNATTSSLLSFTSSQASLNSAFATTGSNTFNGTQTLSGSLLTSGSITATGTITAQTLVVQTVTSSVSFITGSTKFGSLDINSHQFTGSVSVTGSLSSTSLTGSIAYSNLTGVPSGIVSGSSQISYTGLSSIPAGIVSGSSQVTGIGNAQLTNSTISGISLGSNLATLTIGTGLSGTSYNGSTGITIANTGVTSIVAGTNISISGGTGAVTITNGVTNNNQLTNGAGYITGAGNAATATALSSGQSNWSGTGVLGNVVGLLAWKNYSNSHVIFDASNSTSPSGGSVNNTNAQVAWTGTYPTIMGWNGTNTYGVRVDSARVSDSAGTATTATTTTGNAGSVTYLPNRGDVAAYPILWGAAYTNTIGTVAYSCAAVTIQSSTGTVSATTFSGAFSGALTTAQNVVFSNGRKGLVGVYDPTQTQAVFAMGAAYVLTDGGGSATYGPLYGLGWSYNPDYGGAGNNPQSKAGLNHQLLHMQNGVTTTAIGSGIWTGGNITATGDITAYYSDMRLKTKISNIDNALDKVMKLNGFYYVNNDVAKEYGYTSDKVQIGVSAQEIEAVLPEIVTLAPFDATGADAENPLSKSGEHYKTVKYDKIVPLLIEAIKEQQTQIDELKAKLA